MVHVRFGLRDEVADHAAEFCKHEALDERFCLGIEVAMGVDVLCLSVGSLPMSSPPDIASNLSAYCMP